MILKHRYFRMPIQEQDDGPIQPEQYILDNHEELEAFVLAEDWVNCSVEHKRRWIHFAYEGQVRDRRLIFNSREEDKATFSVTKEFPDQLGLTVTMHTDIVIVGLRIQTMEIMED